VEREGETIAMRWRERERRWRWGVAREGETMAMRGGERGRDEEVWREGETMRGGERERRWRWGVERGRDDGDEGGERERDDGDEGWREGETMAMRRGERRREGFTWSRILYDGDEVWWGVNGSTWSLAALIVSVWAYIYIYNHV
jgi:hypothetical protein